MRAQERETNQVPSVHGQKCSLKIKGLILYCFSSISHSCQRSNNSVFDMYYRKHIPGPAFQLSKNHSAELYSEHSVSVPAPSNANELHLSTPTWEALPSTSLSGRGSPYANGSMR